MSATVAWRSLAQRLLRADEAIFLGVHARVRPRWTPLMRTVTALGDPGSWVAHGVLIALLAPGGALLALRLSAAAGIAMVLVQVLKRSCRRARPSRGVAGFVALAQDPDAFSFPSGHTAMACAAAVALAGAVPGLGLALLLLAGLVALSRVYLGAHYPLDVAAGAALGALAGAAAHLV